MTTETEFVTEIQTIAIRIYEAHIKWLEDELQTSEAYNTVLAAEVLDLEEIIAGGVEISPAARDELINLIGHARRCSGSGFMWLRAQYLKGLDGEGWAIGKFLEEIVIMTDDEHS